MGITVPEEETKSVNNTVPQFPAKNETLLAGTSPGNQWIK